jgi:hypothetical protein
MLLFTKHNYKAKKLNYLTLKSSIQNVEGYKMNGLYKVTSKSLVLIMILSRELFCFHVMNLSLEIVQYIEQIKIYK